MLREGRNQQSYICCMVSNSMTACNDAITDILLNKSNNSFPTRLELMVMTQE